jgi:hypothetical protein
LENSLQELKASIAEDEGEKEDAETKPWLAASLKQLKESLKEEGMESVSETAETPMAQETSSPKEDGAEQAEVPTETWHKPAVQPKSWQDIVPAAEPPENPSVNNAPPVQTKREEINEPSGSEPTRQIWQKPQLQPKPWDRDLQTTWQKPQRIAKPWEQQQPVESHNSDQAPSQNYRQLPNLPLGGHPVNPGQRPPEPSQAPIEPNPYRYVERRETPPEIPIGGGISGYREPSYVPGQAPPPQNNTPSELREIPQPPPVDIPLGKGVSGVRFHEDETPLVPSYDPTYYDVPQKTPKITLPKGVGISGWQDGEGPADPAEALRQQAAAEKDRKQNFTANDLLAFADTETPDDNKDKIYQPNEGEELIATLGPDGKVILAVRDKNSNR